MSQQNGWSQKTDHGKVAVQMAQAVGMNDAQEGQATATFTTKFDITNIRIESGRKTFELETDRNKKANTWLFETERNDDGKIQTITRFMPATNAITQNSLSYRDAGTELTKLAEVSSEFDEAKLQAARNRLTNLSKTLPRMAKNIA